MNTYNEKEIAVTKPDLILLVLFLGVLWGLSEGVLGNIIRIAAAPIRAGVLTGIGMGIMGCFWGIARRPLLFPVIALAAAASTELSVPILHCSMLCKANANLAVLLYGSVLSALTLCADRKKGRSAAAYAVVGFAAAGLSSAIFYYAGLNLAPCAYLLSFGGNGGFAHFLMREGVLWAAFSSICFPAGIVAGRRFAEPITSWRDAAPFRWYAASSAATVICLFLIAASILYWH